MAIQEMKKRHIRRGWLVAALALAFFPACQGGSSSSFQAATASTATWNGPHPGPVKPFKEQQFQYRAPLEVGDGGRYLHLPYDEWRDINGRDEIPVRKVKSWWVRKLPGNAQKKLEYRAGGRVLNYNAVGKLSGGSRMTVIYLHGRGGNLEWGFDDERFGGNFNRLKNMMIATGGAYLSPDFTDFDTTGFADVKALIAEYRPRTDGPLIVACGSLGNSHCWRLFQDPQTAGQVDGIIVLAGFPDNRLLSSGKAIPLIMAHGSWDPDYDYKPMVEFYRQLRKARPDFPVRFLLFETGTHGAPIRMIDWRDTLNWIDAQ
jgi:hypothetical protein